MVWTCRAQHRLDCRSTQAECGCTEKIWQAKEIMGWSAWEWQKEARYGFCWPSESFWVERTPSRKTCQKAQPSVEENRALKWIWYDDDDMYESSIIKTFHFLTFHYFCTSIFAWHQTVQSFLLGSVESWVGCGPQNVVPDSATKKDLL